MPSDKQYLHNHPDFSALIRIVGQERGIAPALVEKDYWIMHCLYGLQQAGFQFELKGGTSLSKGHGLIHRFSEDIDIRIEPPEDMDVKTGRNHDKPAHCESRKAFYDWLAGTIAIDGIASVQRDTAFDDEKYRSGGIRLIYRSEENSVPGLKDGILLEVGFDDVTPNIRRDISSWAYEHAAEKVDIKVDIIDNRAVGVACYHPGYTLVEKLQTISTKYRQQRASGSLPQNFMRHYYDVYCLLDSPEVQSFIGTDDYHAHKQRRFRGGDDPVIKNNPAFLLDDPDTRTAYEQAYRATSGLYYQGQPEFSSVVNRIHKHIEKL